MAIFDMPVVASDPNHEFSIELDSTVFLLRLYFNSRDEYWYLDLRTETGDPIQLGKRLAVEMPLLARLKSLVRPGGDFALIDLRSQDIEAVLDTLGIDNPLVYLDAAEIA